MLEATMMFWKDHFSLIAGLYDPYVWRWKNYW